MRKDGIVSKTITNTARFGRVTQYRVTLDGVTFTAEHTAGSDRYSVSTHVGVCGMSGRSSYSGGLPTIAGGRGVADRLLALATELRADPALPFINPEHADSRTRHASLCTDREACGRFRTVHPTDPNTATDAERETARVAGVYAFNTGHPNVWHESERMRAMLNPGDQHSARGSELVGIFEAEWERNADYQRRRDAVAVGA